MVDEVNAQGANPGWRNEQLLHAAIPILSPVYHVEVRSTHSTLALAELTGEKSHGGHKADSITQQPVNYTVYSSAPQHVLIIDILLVCLVGGPDLLSPGIKVGGSGQANAT